MIKQEGSGQHVAKITLNDPQEDVESLLQTNRLISIDLQLTPKEVDALKRLNTEIEGLAGNFLYWGSMNNTELASKLKSYICTLGNNSEELVEIISNIIVRIGKGVTKYFGTEFAWIETKTFKPNTTFSVPRWHTDNKFFAPHTVYKLVWALTGPQTRFGETNDFETFQKLTVLEIQAGHGTKANIQAREKLDSIVKEFEFEEKTGTAVLYRSAGTDPVVHSEPNMNQRRLFLAIVPGSKDEISEWFERKKQKDTNKNVSNRTWWFHQL